jgi:hypothetical protein
MTTLLGFIGFLVILLIALPASLLALIKVFKQPIGEIFTLWVSLIDELLNIYEDIRNGIKK